MNELTVDAIVQNIDDVTDYINSLLENAGCPLKVQMQIDVAVDEVFANISYYAYAPETGKATIRIELIDEPRGVCITFIDEGKQFNPLLTEAPDTSLSADERQIGGLGIFIVRKTMDDVTYEFKDGKNILRITKTF